MPENLEHTDPGLSAPAPTVEPTPSAELSEPPLAEEPPVETDPVAAESSPEFPSDPETTAEETPEPPVEAPSGIIDELPGLPPANPSNKKWYVVKVQSGREETIKEAIERRVKIEGLDDYYGEIVIPVERTYEMRNGRRVKKEHKLYPGYLMVNVEFNDRILYLFRETSGVGDFVGGTITGGINRPPPPMSDREVERMLGQMQMQETGKGPSVPITKKLDKPKFDKGDRLRVKDGTFAGMEGVVKEILEMVGKVKIELTIFGRPVEVEFEYWQVERV